jgi:hypothetical protein
MHWVVELASGKMVVGQFMMEDRGTKSWVIVLRIQGKSTFIYLISHTLAICGIKTPIDSILIYGHPIIC